MSFNIAVWEGETPAGDTEALAEFQRLSAKYLDGDDATETSPAIKAFIAAMTAEYPDIVDLPDDEVDDGVWSDGPLIGNARGPFFYFGIVFSQVEDVAPFVARVALEHGLVCFDPQSGTLCDLS